MNLVTYRAKGAPPPPALRSLHAVAMFATQDNDLIKFVTLPSNHRGIKFVTAI
jgi:hypothetical protein